MSESKHTPGPWWVDRNTVGGFEIKANGIAGIYVLCQRSDWPHLAEMSKANGNMMAAAPELYEAGKLRGFLAEAIEVADTEGMSDSTVLPVWPNHNAGKHPELTVGALRALYAAIAKAEGRDA